MADLPTGDPGAFDEALGIGWQPVGNDLMACAEIGRTIVHGCVSVLSDGSIFSIHKKTPGHPGRCIAQGIFDAKSSDAKTIFYAMFRAACRCIWQDNNDAKKKSKRTKGKVA